MTHRDVQGDLIGSVATLQSPRDRLARCFSWPLWFAVYSNGANLNRRECYPALDVNPGLLRQAFEQIGSLNRCYKTCFQLETFGGSSLLFADRPLAKNCLKRISDIIYRWCLRNISIVQHEVAAKALAELAAGFCSCSHRAADLAAG